MRALPSLFVVLALAASSPARAQAPGPVRMAPPLPVMQAAAPEAAGARPPLTLAQALEATRRNNPDLAAARARLLAGEQAVRKAWSGYLPSVQVGGGWTHNSTEAVLFFPDFSGGFVTGTDPDGNPTLMPANPPQEIAVQQQNQWAAQAQVNQTLLALPLIPTILNGYDLADIARLTAEETTRQLLFGTAQAYYGALGLQEAVKIGEAQVTRLEEHLASAKAALEAGTTPEIAVLRAGIDLTRAQQDLVRSRVAFEEALGTLGVLMGRPDTDFSLVRPEDAALAGAEVPEDAYETALSSRPDLRIADLGLTVSRRGKTASWLQFLPVVGANWTWRYTDVAGFTGENESWALMVNASWTLYDGGLRYAQLNEAEAAVREAKARLEGLQNQVAQEVRTAILQLEAAQGNVLRAEEEVRLARANWEAVDQAFEVGAVSALDTSDAQSALRSAELAQVAEAVRLRVAELALQRAMGAPEPILD